MELIGHGERFSGTFWYYKNNKGETLSIIHFKGSYGYEKGLFEIRPSWRKPSKYDVVKGFLSFGDVQKWINELKSRE